MNYIVGDIQGCYSGLRALLKKVKFNSNQDQLWAVGDLVARGDDSLSTLSYLFDLGDRFTTVLGNHDLHLLSVIHGVKNAKAADNLSDLLASSRIHQFADWLRHFPLAQMIDKKTLLTHAGLFPYWSIKDALRYSKEVEHLLQDDKYASFLPSMYSSKPQSWLESSTGPERPIFIINAMTRMRYITDDGKLDFSAKCSPEDAPNNLNPWFKIRNPELHSGQRVIFGHWASLCGQTGKKNKIALDTGYVWGGALTCFCLETRKIHHVNR